MEAMSVHSQLIAFIRDRRFEPDEKLPSERDLAARFGVNRAVIRESLAVLEAMRLIERRDRSGIYLRQETSVGSLDAVVTKAQLGWPPGEAEISALNEFRTILEMQAIALACSRRTQEDLDRMDDNLALCRERAARGETIAAQSADFHLALIGAAHNQFLLRTAYSYYLATREWREVVFSQPGITEKSIADHQAIRDAVADGDIARTRELVAAHLDVADSYWHDSGEAAPDS
jgi:DNA-binding FadR family transcriptional regulator